MEYDWPFVIDWGNVPQWVAAVFTSAGVLLAAFEYRRAIENRRTEQARKVSVIYELVEWDYSVDDRFGRARVKVSNGSDLPIYDINVAVTEWDFKWIVGDHTRTISNLPANQESTPIEFDRISLPPRSGEGILLHGTLNPPVRLSFTDSAGKRWTRLPNGHLKVVNAKQLQKRWPRRKQ